MVILWLKFIQVKFMKNIKLMKNENKITCGTTLYGKSICNNPRLPDKTVCKECYEFMDTLFD